MLNDNAKNIIENKLKDLENSKFRSGFHLSDKERAYINDKGLDRVREHAYDFIRKNLAPKVILNDGKQTPMRGHPVFVARHATATCCRNCLYKWHHIPKDKELSENEINCIVCLIMEWIKNDYNK